VVAPCDFTRDRELWRWVPAEVTLFMSRTELVQVVDPLLMVTALSDPYLLHRPTAEVCAVGAESVLYACTACSFIGGIHRELTLRRAMTAAGAPLALTTSGEVVHALRALGVRSVAVVHPYTNSVGEKLATFLGEAGIDVVANTGLGFSVSKAATADYATVADLVLSGDCTEAEAVFVSCTALPTYDLIAPLEKLLGKPVVTANQAGMWGVLRSAGLTAVGPGQALLS
jgi:maleate isomerase